MTYSLNMMPESWEQGAGDTGMTYSLAVQQRRPAHALLPARRVVLRTVSIIAAVLPASTQTHGVEQLPVFPDKVKS